MQPSLRVEQKQSTDAEMTWFGCRCTFGFVKRLAVVAELSSTPTICQSAQEPYIIKQAGLIMEVATILLWHRRRYLGLEMAVTSWVAGRRHADELNRRKGKWQVNLGFIIYLFVQGLSTHQGHVPVLKIAEGERWYKYITRHTTSPPQAPIPLTIYNE